MKTTVFRKVMVKDRLPVIFGEYITDIGYMFYNNGQKYFEDRQGVCFPKWFLEEIELPSEQDLRKESLGKFSEIEAQDEEIGEFIEDDALEFMKGANYILSKLR